MQDLRKKFGRLVAANRKRAGLTPEALATAASLSVDMIARIEAGATGVRFATIGKLAAALDTDPANFFTPDLPGGARDRSALAEIIGKLEGLNDKDLAWLSTVLDAILQGR